MPNPCAINPLFPTRCTLVRCPSALRIFSRCWFFLQA